MSSLFVFAENQLVGTLQRDSELVYSFLYEEAWCKSADAFPLSLAMPLSQQNYGNKIALSFFENLLPEGVLRENLEQRQKIKGTFDLLAQFGQDCAGAMVISTERNYLRSIDENKFVEIEMTQIHQAIEEKESVAEVIAGLDAAYLSLAGAQDKFAAIYKDGKFFLPTQGAPTTHIVKTPIVRQGIKDSVFNELYCMELARSLGLNVPPCFVVRGAQPLYVVERYDRMADRGGKIRRLHQQDFCQAQGVTSEMKYEAKGGPSLKNNYDLIVSNVTVSKRLESIHQFLDWLSFNLLIGNNDSHSKNISLLLRTGKIELAPMYDLLCTALYPSLTKEFSFQIGDLADFSKMGKNQFEEMEKQLGLKGKTMQDRFQSLHDLMIEKKDQVATKILTEHPEAKIVHRISELIGDRAKGFRNQKALRPMPRRK